MTANPPPQPGTPPSHHVRVEGTVAAVHADGRFTLALPDGQVIAGTAPRDQLRSLGRAVAERVLVLGVDQGGVLVADGVVPLDTPSGRRLSVTEIAEHVERARAVTGDTPEATEEVMDAMMRDDR